MTKYESGNHHEKISQLMNELRHFKEKNNKLIEELNKRGASMQEVINANSTLK